MIAAERGAVDVRSLEIIENAIAACGKFFLQAAEPGISNSGGVIYNRIAKRLCQRKE